MRQRTDFAKQTPHATQPTSRDTDQIARLWGGPPQQVQPETTALPTYAARDLTQKGGQAQIILDDQTYTLRITRAGKLILTK